MSIRFRFSCIALALLAWNVMFLTRATYARQSAAPQEAKKVIKDQPAPQAKPEEAKKTEGPKPGEDKTFAEVIKDFDVKQGLFTFYYKADENKLLLEILPSQLDKVFMFAGTTEQAVGERGFYSSQQGGSFPFVFRRLGKSVQWVEKNTSFTAASGTPAARFTERSFPDAILGTAKLLSKPHPERNSILIDVAELFVSDLPGFAPALNQVYQPTTYRFDKAGSWVGNLKPYPQNVLLDVWLHFVTDNPRTPSITLADQRSIPILVKYDFSAIPDTGYKPR